MACKSVLVVDDDADIRETVQELLRLEGYDVHTAANGREAIETLHRIKRPCLILLDLMMPVMSGWEFMTQREHDDVIASIPVVVASAAGERVRKPDHAASYMGKPIDVEALLAMIQYHCRENQAKKEGQDSDAPKGGNENPALHRKAA